MAFDNVYLSDDDRNALAKMGQLNPPAPQPGPLVASNDPNTDLSIASNLIAPQSSQAPQSAPAM